MTAPVFDIKDAISEAVASAMPTPVADQPDPVAPQEGEASTPDEGNDVALEADDSSDDTDSSGVALPEGYVAVPTVTEGLATEFALYDDDGEVEVPALMVEYKANGKVRKDRLDQVVKLAQWGVYNEERDRKAAAVEQEYQSTLEAVQQMEQAIAQREAQMERLLNDEDFLEAVREAYHAENSPEKRAERAERETNNLRVSYQMQQIQSSGEQFYTTEVMPAVKMIMDALPSVTAEELESRLQMVMQAHVETAPNGQPYVPPSRYDAIRQYIVDDLALWAQMVNAKRSQPVNDEKASVKAELDRARVEAQKAKNLVGKAMKPAGQAGKATDAPKRPAKPANIDDAISSALSSVLSSISS
jgi:hypothetical protein